MRCDLVNHREQLVSVVALRCQRLCFLESRHLLYYAPRSLRVLDPSFPLSKPIAETALSAVKGKAVASHTPAAL